MSKTEKLKFPIIKEPLPAARRLSVDEYLKFVTFNLKYAVDRKAARKQKKLEMVNVPFVLK